MRSRTGELQNTEEFCAGEILDDPLHRFLAEHTEKLEDLHEFLDVREDPERPGTAMPVRIDVESSEAWGTKLNPHT